MPFNATRLSRILHWIFLAGLVALPLFSALLFLNLKAVLASQGAVQILPFGVTEGIAEAVVNVTLLTKALGFAVSLVPTLLTCAVLWNLAALFKEFSQGRLFTSPGVRRIRRAGIFLLTRELLAPVVGGLMSVALTASNPPGQGMLIIGLDASNLTMIVTALTIIVVAHIMDQARELQDESLLTI